MTRRNELGNYSYTRSYIYDFIGFCGAVAFLVLAMCAIGVVVLAVMHG